MKKNKIVVLSNLDGSTQNILKSAVSLAKMINGEIELFSVTKPTEIIGSENQLSAIRTLNDQHTLTSKKVKSFVNPIIQGYGIDIKTSFVIGNVKNEIKNFITEKQPDIIVLGKRKSAPYQLIGDSITPFVFKTFKGSIMVATDENTLEPNQEISLGTLNSIEPLNNLAYAEDFMANSKDSLKSFKIIKKTNVTEELTKPSTSKTVEFVFEHNDSSIKSLSKYITKSKINLLYLDRMNKQADNNMVSDIKNLVNSLNVTLMVTST